jgi:succinate dehydrogenase / fumarate reductase, cytochrome b subunit
MARNTARPLSPHLTIWRTGIHMFVSIFNRAMAVGLASVGVIALVWWLTAAASGAAAYDAFIACARGWMGIIVAVGLSFAFFFHLVLGLRHFVLDAGAGFELNQNRFWAWASLAAAVFLTACLWLIISYKGL